MVATWFETGSAETLQRCNRAGKMQCQTDFCSGCLAHLPFLHFLCQESSGELTLTPWHYYKLRPGLQPSGPRKTSPFGSVFNSFLFPGEERELTEIQTGESEIYMFEWASFKRQVCSCTTFPSSPFVTLNINVLLNINSPKLQAVPSAHDRNMSWTYFLSMTEIALEGLLTGSYSLLPHFLIVQWQPRGSFEQLQPTCGYSHPSFPWPSSPGETRRAAKPEAGYLRPWAVKRCDGVPGKQSERHEEAVPPCPPSPGGPTRSGRSGSRSRATGLFDCLSLVARQ